MPIYHFHDADGVRHNDAIGTDLADDSAAKFEAVRYAGAMLRDKAQKLLDDGQWRVEVTDRNNVLLFTVITIAIDAPKPDFAHRPPANSGK